MSKILNEYCDNCPFPSNGKNLCLDKNRIPNVKNQIMEDDRAIFHCHKTLGEDEKMCYGATKYLYENRRPNIIMRILKWEP